MNSAIEPNKLFFNSRVALAVTGISFGIRGAIASKIATQFHFDAQQLGLITGTAFWGFPIAVILGGILVDAIGMKRILQMAGLFHLVGTLLWVFSTGFWTFFFSTLLIGLANGTVESACNPLVATIFSNNKTTKLNHFHLWFPGGILIGTIISLVFERANLDWKFQVAVMLLPTIYYLYNFSKLAFPPTERVASGVTTLEMFKAVLSPLFICMIVLMFGTAITELFTEQWIEVLLHNVLSNAILILSLTATIEVIGRSVAGPVVHRFSPTGVLLISAVLASAGIYTMAHASGMGIFAGAVVFALGVTYFWPTMLGFVSENIPKSGALGMNLMGGAGMFAVSIYLAIMGGNYDAIVTANLPSGASLASYQSAPAGSDMALALSHANSMAGPSILMRTFFIPAFLILAFLILYFYMKGRSKPVLSKTPDPQVSI